RVNTPKNVAIFNALGIEAVSSTQSISQLLENEFDVGALVHLTSLRGGKVSLVEVRIPTDEHGPAPRFVSELTLPHDVVLCAIFRNEAIIIPRGTTQVLPGDEVVALTTPELESRLRELLVGKS
ncbi:MAG: trk system potassium uptake protein TrkA, partial [Glaciecola sp.]